MLHKATFIPKRRTPTLVKINMRMMSGTATRKIFLKPSHSLATTFHMCSTSMNIQSSQKQWRIINILAREKGWTCSGIQAIHTMLTPKMKTSSTPLILRSRTLGTKMKFSARF